ncbi:uncharacterized protein [Clytia hemisphaerica]|uniref:uncharacterized protein n=1 Tax=Clytia hemisphaerica TaxID=252671 RepID=UPI0034D4A22E
MDSETQSDQGSSSHNISEAESFQLKFSVVEKERILTLLRENNIQYTEMNDVDFQTEDVVEKSTLPTVEDDDEPNVDLEEIQRQIIAWLTVNHVRRVDFAKYIGRSKGTLSDLLNKTPTATKDGKQIWLKIKGFLDSEEEQHDLKEVAVNSTQSVKRKRSGQGPAKFSEVEKAMLDEQFMKEDGKPPLIKKKAMAKMAGCSVQQVTNWIYNSRRKEKIGEYKRGQYVNEVPKEKRKTVIVSSDEEED